MALITNSCYFFLHH